MFELKVFNRELALTYVGDDIELLMELIQMFSEEYESNLDKLDSSIQSGDCQSIAATAHSIKGELKTLGAEISASIAAKMEEMCRQDELSDIGHHFVILREEINRFVRRAIYDK
ncbi:Hpt domain-containing protein [bacterium]|nr:Hpt domain-containing protein [bacterium]